MFGSTTLRWASRGAERRDLPSLVASSQCIHRTLTSLFFFKILEFGTGCERHCWRRVLCSFYVFGIFASYTSNISLNFTKGNYGLCQKQAHEVPKSYLLNFSRATAAAMRFWNDRMGRRPVLASSSMDFDAGYDNVA